MLSIYHKYNIFYLVVFSLFIINGFTIFFINQNQGCVQHVNRVSFLDIGQGDAIYIENSEGQNLLIDTGNKDSGVIKQIQKVTMCNKVHIQNLLLTHPDQDHIGEATRLIEMGLVDKIIHNGFLDIDQKNESMTENNLEQAVKDNNITTQNIFKNHDIGFKVFNETYLFPIVEPYTDKKGQSKAVDDNDYSIVLKMSYGGQSFMLTGDAPQKAEKDMIKEYCNGSNKMSTSTTDCPTLKSTVLKLGHHGSKNSSSQEWLDRVDATDYIVSAGFKNKYGHPNKEVLQRVYNRPDSRVRKTSVEGNIVYLLD